MVRQQHQLRELELEQTLGDSGGQGSLACCSPRGHKESDATYQLNNYCTQCKQQSLTYSMKKYEF